jgi:hypothetical protein
MCHWTTKPLSRRTAAAIGCELTVAAITSLSRSDRHDRYEADTGHLGAAFKVDRWRSRASRPARTSEKEGLMLMLMFDEAILKPEGPFRAMERVWHDGQF